MTILITGANGNVSSALIRSLDGRDDLRALVRDPVKAPEGVRAFVGDLDHPDTLDAAFEGVDTLWLLTAMGPQSPHASMNAVWAAKKAGVKHVVRLSAIGAGHDAPTRNGRLHALSDVELAASGLDWTVIRPAFFMQNLLGSVNGDTLYGPTGAGKVGLIDVRDIADFGAKILESPQKHAGKTYTITGPESISLEEASNSLAEVYQTKIKYQPVSPADAYRSMLDYGLSEWVAAVSVEYAKAYSAGWGDFTTPDFEQVTGRKARRFTEFAVDHAALLRS
ncbi:SDR family oxidoreductase [Nonomuraea sp. NBC_01738]|uniref:SDR family oxidoreductase n=1 Tax=Nonomuraea sp. NBC_01738 TaxID=2976003 RepID=UPI002E0E4800|nr:SDR family oxidoreductase [Nonomuraea sp. NBC_01738]